MTSAGRVRSDSGIAALRGRAGALRLLAACLVLLAWAASGGPDAFGYTWRDTAEPGVTFAFEDIAATGVVLSAGGDDDVNYGFRPLSFRFPYYGRSFGQIAACSNGWISPIEDVATSFQNALIPARGSPRAVIAALWDDLGVPATGSVTFQDLGDRAIFQWTDVQVLAEPAFANTFQVILRASGQIDVNWLLSPLPAPDEHYVVLRADDSPRGPFLVVASPLTREWTDPDAPARFAPTHCWYYDVRVADACGNLSGP